MEEENQKADREGAEEETLKQERGKTMKKTLEEETCLSCKTTKDVIHAWRSHNVEGHGEVVGSVSICKRCWSAIPEEEKGLWPVE